MDLDRHANNERDYAATSITPRVPNLVHDGFALSESSAITDLPQHLAAYAQRQWQRPSVQRWVQLQRPA